MVAKPRATRALASEIMDIEQVESVDNHNGSTGEIEFSLKEGRALSQRRLNREALDGWKTNVVMHPDESQVVYVEKQI